MRRLLSGLMLAAACVAALALAADAFNARTGALTPLAGYALKDDGEEEGGNSDTPALKETGDSAEHDKEKAGLKDGDKEEGDAAGGEGEGDKEKEKGDEEDPKPKTGGGDDEEEGGAKKEGGDDEEGGGKKKDGGDEEDGDKKKDDEDEGGKKKDGGDDEEEGGKKKKDGDEDDDDKKKKDGDDEKKKDDEKKDDDDDKKKPKDKKPKDPAKMPDTWDKIPAPTRLPLPDRPGGMTDPKSERDDKPNNRMDLSRKLKHKRARRDWRPKRKHKQPKCPLTRVSVQLADTVRSELTPEMTLRFLTAYTGFNELDNNAARAEAELTDTTKLPQGSVQDHFFSCWDGRHEYAILGTPGGDIAEFILALNAVERTRPLSMAFTEQQVYAYLQAWLARRNYFYLHSDRSHYSQWAAAANTRDPLLPTTELERENVIRLAPAFIGCHHLKLMFTKEADYQTRHALVEYVLKSAIRLATDATDPLQPRIKFVVLEGVENREQAVVQVFSPTGREDTATEHKGCEYHAPLIVPKIFAPSATSLRSALVVHPRAQWEYRAQLANFFMETERADPEWRAAVFETMNSLGQLQQQLTQNALGGGGSWRPGAQVGAGAGIGVQLLGPTGPGGKGRARPTFIADFNVAPPYKKAIYPNPAYMKYRPGQRYHNGNGQWKNDA